MKNLLAVMILLAGSVIGISAQSEGFFGYTLGYGKVRVQVTPLSEGTSVNTLDEQKEITHGFTIGYVYYFQRKKSAKPTKVGLGTDVNAQFFDGHAVTATWVAGLMVKGRTDKKVQPFVRVMPGIGRIGFKECFCNSAGLVSTARFGSALVTGAGFDVQSKHKRLGWRFGVDYVWTHIQSRDQQFVRFTTGLVFK